MGLHGGPGSPPLLFPFLCDFSIPFMEEVETMEVSEWDKNERVEKYFQEWVYSLMPVSTFMIGMDERQGCSAPGSGIVS